MKTQDYLKACMVLAGQNKKRYGYGADGWRNGVSITADGRVSATNSWIFIDITLEKPLVKEDVVADLSGGLPKGDNIIAERQGDFLILKSEKETKAYPIFKDAVFPTLKQLMRNASANSALSSIGLSNKVMEDIVKIAKALHEDAFFMRFGASDKHAFEVELTNVPEATIIACPVRRGV